jgi:plastocyanin
MILFYYRPADISEDNQVWRMNADGTGLVRLTNTTGQNWAGVYSPDGLSIAFSSLRDGDREIYVMNADGSGQTNITNRHASSDLAPYWIGSLGAIGPSRTITLAETGFTTDALTVPVGTQVIWYNATSQTHILQSDPRGLIYLPLVVRNAPDMGVSAITAGTIYPGQSTGASWEKGFSGGESFGATLAPGETFAHIFATEGDYHYHLETPPYFVGLVTVVSKEAYCSQDAITTDSLEAARAALQAGATAVSLSPAGCIRYNRTMSGTTVMHEELTVSDWTMETWDHTTTQSLGLRDADLDGYFEWRSTVDRGPLVTDGRVVTTMYFTDTHWLARRETYERLSEETMHVVWEEDTEKEGWLTTVADFDTSTFDIYSGTLTTTLTLAGGEPPGQISPAGACSEDQLKLIWIRLGEGVKQGVDCLNRHGRFDVAAAVENYTKRKFDISCETCDSVAEIEKWPDPTVPVKLRVCNSFFTSDANWQRSTMFHEMQHLSEPDHDPAIEKDAGQKIWEVDPIYACESMCFNDNATKCSCATCLKKTVCSGECSGYGACNPQLGAKCLCPSRPQWYPTLALCDVVCPSGVACFGSKCKTYDVSCRP